MSESEQILLSIESACVIAVECWRLLRSPQDQAAANYSARRIAEELATMGITFLDLSGRSYDPGLAPEVISTILDDDLAPETSVIAETIVPTIMLNGEIVQPGQIVVKSAPSAALEN